MQLICERLKWLEQKLTALDGAAGDKRSRQTA
jgi:hypothetical protein